MVTLKVNSANPTVSTVSTDFVGAAVDVTRHVVPAARHPVLVARLRDGGVISYAWPDGRFLHTLADADGFARKLAQLGLG